MWIHYTPFKTLLMATALVIIELLIVLSLIFIGTRIGGIGLGVFGMVGVFVLVYGFRLPPGTAPVDVMMIIVAVITAASALQASGGLDYLVGVAARFLRNHPDNITYFGPIICWLFCVVAGTAHTSYSLLPIISEVAQANRIRPEGVSMSQTIEMIMMSDAALILLVGKGKVGDAVNGNIFKAGMNAVVAIFGVAWMGNTFYMGNEKVLDAALSSMITSAPILFAVALFLLSIMLFSQAATVTTLYPVGIALGVNPLLLIAMFPACNGYFFLPNYPTEVAAIDFDRTGTTHVGRYVVNHSFQLPGFITTVVSIGLGVLVIQFL